MLGVFAEWNGFCTAYLSQPLPPPPNLDLLFGQREGSDDTDIPYLNLVYASADLLRTESRFRSSMRSAVSHLEPVIASSSGSASTGTRRIYSEAVGLIPLGEHIELRGFLPLANVYEVCWCGVLKLFLCCFVG